MLIDTLVPNYFFSTTASEHACFNDYRKRWLVLYFYPKDATPGCTLEARDFRDAYPDFSALDADILGVSRDSLSLHQAFKEKNNLPFDLISDPDEQLCQYFDVMKIKSMYGKKLRGIERSTFLIDPKGVIVKEWRRVKIIGHVDEVKAALNTNCENS